ncbi:hypothetical protein TG4357_03728 [Thalassovita gelatinovora]|uniref:Uncharacterized protein n=1 Tax=Thalassovita gelatinovora TaxID=53501 RepID=A0A0P1FKM1_THAGE|nr:hypothetical protein [Thalassovita gelatinovora]QIZ79062.1 hypothetical protein HFZ77_00515 [Thalassovita gelatinovora]CUH68667.1 hypothetical protein TG4357_03728 [Thalassovita gelatinovora]SEQ56384.1 hypothetical protein SAMN04488043_106189 [Thalassovita gelatinovora]
MEGQELKEGRDRVRLNLIAPLKEWGMERRGGWTVERETEMLDRLQNKLAYMSAVNLEALRETVQRHATGKARDRWPKEMLIENWARRLQDPPISMSRLVRSYIQSGAGRAARDGGYLVELFFYLKRVGAPPNAFSMDEIRSEAEANRERRARIKVAREAGRATPSDLAWMDGYYMARQRCIDTLNAGQASKQEGQAA